MSFPVTSNTRKEGSTLPEGSIKGTQDGERGDVPGLFKGPVV